MINPDDIKQLIEAGMPEAQVKVLGDDGTHFEALVVSAEFENKPTVARHRMVYDTLGQRMGGEIHALSLRTLTPEQVAAGGQ
jgi:acid stress-induced BolA-like protein IbaG/YrbA